MSEAETIVHAVNEMLRQKARDRDRIEELEADVEKLTRNAVSDAKWMAAYHKWCEMNGCAPSSSDLSVARAALEGKKDE